MKAGKSVPIRLAFAFFIWLGCWSSGWAAEQTNLKASYAAISGNFAPIWIAQDKALFAKYGLAVDLNFVPPSTATQSLVGKSLDIIAPGGEIVEAPVWRARRSLTSRPSPTESSCLYTASARFKD